jgi:hypothetical protein
LNAVDLAVTEDIEHAVTEELGTLYLAALYIVDSRSRLELSAEAEFTTGLGVVCF